MKKKKNVKHNVFKEKLRHFLCNKCSHWWTVGDSSFKKKQKLYCVHCGNKQKVV